MASVSSYRAWRPAINTITFPHILIKKHIYIGYELSYIVDREANIEDKKNMTSSDMYGEVFQTALDVIIRRIGWRLTEEALNPLGFKARTGLDLETWGMHNNAPDKALREVTELSAGGIHNQAQYDQHLDFMIDALDFYQGCVGAESDPHIFDQLIPVLRDNNHQLTFYSNDLVFADIVLDDNAIAREWRLAPKFVATQENPMGRHLRSFGFVPSLDFVGHKRYTEKIKH